MHRGKVEVEEPPQPNVVVVVLLFSPMVSNPIVIGDLEKLTLVLAQKVLLDLRTVEFQKVHEDPDSLLLLLTG